MRFIKSRAYSKFIGIVLLIGFIAIGAVGGCSDNNGGDGGGEPVTPPTPPGTSSCIPESSPCAEVSVNSDKTIASCFLSRNTCAVDLMDVITQVGNGVTANTPLWITAKGGAGGKANRGSAGGLGSFAMTTTNVSKLMSMNNNSSILYYFVGAVGNDGDDHCGGGGGASTIVTFEDLTLNPTANPTQSAPPLLLVGGGGGGGSAGNGDACGFGACQGGHNPGCHGVNLYIISDESGNANGPGLLEGYCGGCAEGGNVTKGDFDGGRGCESAGGGVVPESGWSGIGGIGGAGGKGQGCNGPSRVGWSNTGSVTLSFTNGAGGNGGGAGDCCDSGGGGGGGGAGGGGGGGHGNGDTESISGGAGGSFAIKSEISTTIEPPQYGPENTCYCDGECWGCVAIQFCLTSDCQD